MGFEVKYGNGGIWPKGKIFYDIDEKVKNDREMLLKVNDAIKE